MTREASDKDTKTKRKRSKLERVDKKVDKKEKPKEKPKRKTKPKPKASFSQEIKQSVVVKIGDDNVKRKRKRKVQKKLPVKKEDESRTPVVQTIFPVQPVPQQQLRPPMGPIVPQIPTAPPPFFTDESVNQLVNDEQMKLQRAKLSKQEAERQQVRGLLDDVVEDVFKKVDSKEQAKREAEKKRVDASKSLAVIDKQQKEQNARVALIQEQERIKKREQREQKELQDREQRRMKQEEDFQREQSRRFEEFQSQRQTDALATQEQIAQIKATKGTDDETKSVSTASSVQGSTYGQPTRLGIPPIDDISIGRSTSDESVVSELTEDTGSPRLMPKQKPPLKKPQVESEDIRGFFPIREAMIEEGSDEDEQSFVDKSVPSQPQDFQTQGIQPTQDFVQQNVAKRGRQTGYKQSDETKAKIAETRQRKREQKLMRQEEEQRLLAQERERLSQATQVPSVEQDVPSDDEGGAEEPAGTSFV